MDLVVAKYKEDVSWLSRMNANHIVYDKGSGQLPNIGREAHTYAYHIVNNYDSLPEWTAFVQGKPFDHCQHLYNLINDFDKIVEQNPEEKFFFLGTWITKCDLNGNPHHAGLDLKLFQELVFGDVVQEEMTFVAGAQFIVHSDLIKNKSKKFWEKYLSIFEDKLHPQDAWCAERLWPYLFNLYKDV
jgi:hypothetical protein